MSEQNTMGELLALAEIATVSVSKVEGDQYRFEARRFVNGRELACAFLVPRESIEDGGTKVLRFRLMTLIRAMSAEAERDAA